MIEIKMIGLSQDVNPNSDTVGHIILSEGKGDVFIEQDDIEEKESTSVKARQFVLQKLIMPFSRDLRLRDPTWINELIDHTISDRENSF